MLCMGIVCLLVSRIYLITETDKIHFGDIGIFSCLRQHGVNSDFSSLFKRVAIDATADRGKGNTVKPVFMRQLHAALITAFEQGGLVGVATMPDRSDGVDHVPGGQPVTSGDFGVTGGAAVQCPALGQQLGPGDTVNGAINTATAQQGIVGGVDDGIHLQGGDVVFNNVNDCQICAVPGDK